MAGSRSAAVGKTRTSTDVAAVDQPGVAGDDVRPAADPCSRGSVADRPRREPGPLDPGAGGGQLGADLRGQLAAQRARSVPLATSRPRLVHDPERDGQVLGQPVELPRVAGDLDAAHPAQLALQAVEQRLLAGVQPGQHGPGVVGGGANCRRSSWAAS